MEHSKNRQTITGILVSIVLIFATFTMLGEAVGGHASPLVVDADGEASIDSSSQADCDSDTQVDNITTFESIQDAIDYDTNGESHFIIVCPGTYSEIVIESDDGFDKIYGLPGAIIDEDDDDDDGVNAVTITGVCSSTDRMILDGFRIVNGVDGVEVEDSCRVFIQDNNIHDNTDEGIDFMNTDHSWIHNNEIHDNINGGIEIDDDSDFNFIGKNRIFDNTGNGIEINGSTSTDNLISQNTLTNNDEWAVCLCDPAMADVTNNKVVGNRATSNGAVPGALGGGGYLVIGDSNTFTNNRAMSNTGPGFKIDVWTTSTTNTFTKNIAEGNTGDGFANLGDNNTFKKNLAKLNMDDGFEATPSASGNTYRENTANSNVLEGFNDDSVGGGTAGTANTYINNKCITDGSDPDGLGSGCT